MGKITVGERGPAAWIFEELRTRAYCLLKVKFLENVRLCTDTYNQI